MAGPLSGIHHAWKRIREAASSGPRSTRAQRRKVVSEVTREGHTPQASAGLRGEPSGHFVVLSGYHRQTKLVTVADPMHPNPMAPSQYYDIKIDRVLCAILLGIVTHDANLLIIEPRRSKKPKQNCERHRYHCC